MYRIINVSSGEEIGIVDSIFYIKVSSSGSLIPTDHAQATGVAFNSTPYNLTGFNEILDAPTVVISEFDGASMINEQRQLIDSLVLSALGVTNK